MIDIIRNLKSLICGISPSDVSYRFGANFIQGFSAGYHEASLNIKENTENETCRMMLCAAGNDYARYACSECEQETMVPCVVEGVSHDYRRPRYCVNCGRRVVK